MKKTNEQKLNEKFEYLLEAFICGNQSEIINFLNKSNKKIILKFMIYLYDKYSDSFLYTNNNEYYLISEIDNVQSLFEYIRKYTRDLIR